jgi:hypothetical protein
MKVSTFVRRTPCVAALMLLIAFAWWGASGGLRNMLQATTGAQKLEGGIQVGFGLLSVAVVVTRFRWGSVHGPVRVTWVVALAATVGLSALVWGPPMPKVAALFVGVALLVAWAVLWALGRPVPGR